MEFNCTFEQFKQQCKELRLAVKDGLDDEGLENGAKMLGLSLLYMHEEMWQNSAKYAYQITLRECGFFERMLG